jgi:hypothetical protein
VIFRPDVQFSSGFPYDGDHDVDVQPGRNIAETLRTALAQLGYHVSEPIDAGDHGWELDIWRGRKRLWLQISVLDADECYLMTENMTFWLWLDIRLFRVFLTDLQRVLLEDDRFHVIGWFSKNGSAHDMQPADAPFDA